MDLDAKKTCLQGFLPGCTQTRERNDSEEEYLTQDQRVAGLSLTGGTALCP